MWNMANRLCKRKEYNIGKILFYQNKGGLKDETDYGKKKIIASFSERKFANKIAKRLDFKTFIEEVLLDDEGKVIKRHEI